MIIALIPLHQAAAQKVSAKNINALSDFPLALRKKIREVEKYQWNIAEKYYRAGDYKVAAGEYEKYLKLYERSLAAPYAQLKWSNCQVRLKKLNTAIKDGYQSVIDYWPDSPAAISARFLIGRTHKDLGEMKAAKRVLNEVVKKHPKHDVAVFALAEMVDIATVEKDAEGRVALWKRLTYDIPRDKGKRAGKSSRNGLCAAAAVSLARHHFNKAAFDEGLKALATTYPEKVTGRWQTYERAYYVDQNVRPAIQAFMRDAKTKAQGRKLADRAIAYVEKQVPGDVGKPADNMRARRYLESIVRLHSDVGRDDEALQTFQRMLTLFKDADEILEKMALWLEDRRRYDEARKAYGRFANKTQGASKAAQSYLKQAAGYWNEKKRSLAVVYCQRAAAAYGRVPTEKPEDKFQVQAGRAAAFRRAAIYSRESRKTADAVKFANEAIAVYQQLIADDGKNSQNWRMEIARTYSEIRNYKQAIAIYRQCGSVFPASQIEMARCHRALKNYKAALAAYQPVINSKHGGAELYYEVALMYRQSKNKTAEIDWLRRICKRFPRHRRASHAHTWLQTKYMINVTFGGKKEK